MLVAQFSIEPDFADGYLLLTSWSSRIRLTLRPQIPSHLVSSTAATLKIASTNPPLGPLQSIGFLQEIQNSVFLQLLPCV